MLFGIACTELRWRGVGAPQVQYYGLQSLSWRNAMYHAVMSNETGFSQDVMFCDFVHPTPLGHR